MKIAIFENEYETIEMAFKYVNLKYYENKLNFKNYPRSQDINSIVELKEYRLVIIDIDLSSKSDLDGFGLIKKIENEFNEKLNILILTGQELSIDYHTKNNLKETYPILQKPVNYNKIKDMFYSLGLK